jgi:ribosome assembly protein YihI (activator of Der GTPase)
MAKHSEDGSRTSREELAGNKSSEQEQDPVVSFHKGPMPLQGVKGHTTTTTTMMIKNCHFLQHIVSMNTDVAAEHSTLLL